MSAGFDKGERITQETISYFKQIHAALGNLNADEHEEKGLLLDNLFKEVKGREYRLCVNPRCSEALESALAHCAQRHITAFLKGIHPFIAQLMSDRCSSHVVQAMFKRIPQVLLEAEDLPQLDQLLNETWEILGEQWWELAQNAYATHCVRELLKIEGNAAAGFMIQSLQEYSPVDVEQLMKNQFCSPVLQILLEVVQDAKAKDVLIKKLALHGFVNKSKDKFASRVLEKAFSLCGNNTFREIIEQQITPNIQTLAEHHIANFVLQAALSNLRHQDQIIQCVESLSPHFQSLMSQNRAGVIWKLTESCIKFEAHDAQKLLVSSLTKSYSGDSLMKSLLSIQYEKIDHAKCMIAQNLLQFKAHNVQICKDFTSLEVDFLLALSRNPAGSHVVEAFLKNSDVADKTKNRFIDTFTGKFAGLASTPHGSRCVEAFFDVSSLTRKKVIVEEINSVYQKLKGSAFGRAVLSKLSVDTWKRSNKEWEERLGKKNRTREVFADILQDQQAKKKHKQ